MKVNLYANDTFGDFQVLLHSDLIRQVLLYLYWLMILMWN